MREVGLALTIDALTAEDSQALQEWIEPIAKSVGATVLVTDDADGFKTVADEAGLQHQVCKAHVLRNTDTLIERYQPLAAKDADGELAAIGVSPQQAVADLERLGELVRSRQREQAVAATSECDLPGRECPTGRSTTGTMGPGLAGTSPQSRGYAGARL